MPHLNILGVSSAGIKQSHPSLHIPERPKKPLTPYFRFQVKMRKKVLEMYPNLKSFEVPKIVSQEWKKLGEEEKKKMSLEYNKDKEAYLERVKQYQEQLSAEDVEHLKKLRQEKKLKKEKRVMNKLFRETQKPKRPGNAFFLFVKESMKNPENKDRKYMQVISDLSKVWATMEASVKEKYILQYRKDLDQYKKDIRKWEEGVIKEGKLDLLPTQKGPQYAPSSTAASILKSSASKSKEKKDSA